MHSAIIFIKRIFDWLIDWEMPTSGPGSEPDDGEELGDDDAPDWWSAMTELPTGSPVASAAAVFLCSCEI